jgi:hypothetical protein
LQEILDELVALTDWKKALNKGVSTILRLMSALQQPASLYCQIVQCHLQLCSRRTNFWVLSDLLLQGF